MLKALFYRTKTDLCPDLNPYLKPCVDLNCFNSLHESFVNLRPVTIIKPQCQQSDKVRHEETDVSVLISATPYLYIPGF